MDIAGRSPFLLPGADPRRTDGPRKRMAGLVVVVVLSAFAADPVRTVFAPGAADPGFRR